MLFRDCSAKLFSMNTLFEIVILATLNLFLFGYVHRKMAILVVAQRNQIIVLKRSVKKPKLKERDRLLWMFLSRIWADWKEHLVIVKPETVIKWHRRKFKDYWRKLSKPKNKVGRPRITKEHIEFIRRISTDHPDYSGTRIAGMLKELFGVDYAPRLQCLVPSGYDLKFVDARNQSFLARTFWYSS